MSHTILIVDDSLTVRGDLEDAFTEAGFAVVLCGDAASARQALERETFALAVLDVMLPDGDGIELLKAIKTGERTARLPVMLLSSEDEVSDRVRGLATGADEYVGKPYVRNYVVDRARELIRRAGAPTAARQSPLVLVIDDSLTFREELKTCFEARGYAVRTAATGEEGLRLAVQLRPDAVVVDGKLPGIDGATVVRRLRSDVAVLHTPCLLLTASEEQGDELRSLEAGADTYVRKDEGTEAILARLSAIIRTAVTRVDPGFDRSLLGPKRILAVDDSPTYLHELTESLRQDDYDVVQARSGEEALRLLRVQLVDCILLDLVMPGLTGEETCQRIKHEPAWSGIPVIVLTSRDDRAALIGGFQAGADDFIPKSSEFEVLKARLRAQLRRKQFEDESRRMREELQRKELEAAESKALAQRELAEARARLVEQLEHANADLEAFNYSVSHDLRSPLRAISGFAQILATRFVAQLPADGQNLLHRIQQNSRKMDGMINDLLTFSRLSRQPLQKQSVDLAILVRQAVEQLEGERKDRCVQITIGELGFCHADENLLMHVLVNLLSNALKFTRTREVAVIEVGSVGESTADLVYFVKDNGVGFDMQHAQKLFGVFQRLHSLDEFEGTGVGLSLVKRIVRRHGGRIWAEAELDKGATFYFTLDDSVSGNGTSSTVSSFSKGAADP